jgi:tryptophan 7-halogenase
MQRIRNIVIVGGGSAGWITAGLLASEHGPAEQTGVSVSLIESPDVRTIGVGEGTWPTMRSTLRRIGIPESEFIRECAASFKQGTRFVGWVNGTPDDVYYHPFSVPAGYPTINLVPHWQPHAGKTRFANAVCTQADICDRRLAPKQAETPEYAHVLNYGYHLDAGKFAELLKQHCIEKLGVRHLLDHVTGINGDPDGDIRSLATAGSGDLEGDLFIDCSGFAALLLGRHYGVGLIDQRHILFNDSAMAMQVPYPEPDTEIESQTNSSAREAGWIWDIGLSSRRGVGYVYSSQHCSDERAEQVLRDYAGQTVGIDPDRIDARKIGFTPGFRERFWHRNCVAVGMSAGFLEPLEASALVMVELAATMISEELPHNRASMDIVARRFNDKFRYRWDRIIDFLKLHYVLSQRSDSEYWADNRDPVSIPERLAELLALWRHQLPAPRDFSQVDEVFSAASYQYVLFGMGFATKPRASTSIRRAHEQAQSLFIDNRRQTQRMLQQLPGNRELLDQITRQALPA